MHTSLLFLTTMALGVMVGITGTHFQQVNTMVLQAEGAQHVAPLELSPPLMEAGPQPDLNLVTNEVSNEVQAASPAAGGDVKIEGGVRRIDPLLEILAEMRGEQKRMRQQLAETNRDLAEANFRLDTHSDSFKPLSADVERPRSLDSPPAMEDGGAGSGHLLLPPKP